MNAVVQKDETLQYSNKPKYNVLYLKGLHIEKDERNKGWGKYFIDFLKNESFNKKCEGRITLVAYDSDKSPYLFCRKQGFESKIDYMNKRMDKFIKNNWKIGYWDALHMYLPINN